MKSKVKVTADKAGNVISVSKNNPEWGHIRVEQSRMIVDDKGFARRVRLSALIPGEVADLAAFGYVDGTELPGTIYIKEQTKAFDKMNPERELKVAGSTGIICKIGDEPIFRKNFYSSNPDKLDELVEHTNKAEITAAYAAEQSAKAIQPSAEFNV